MKTDTSPQRMLMVLLTNLIDKHYLARGSFDLQEMGVENGNRGLVVAIDYEKDILHVAVCEKNECQAQADRMRLSLGLCDT